MVKEDLEELLLKAPSFHKCYNSQNAIILKDAVEDLRNISYQSLGLSIGLTPNFVVFLISFEIEQDLTA